MHGKVQIRFVVINPFFVFFILNYFVGLSETDVIVFVVHLCYRFYFGAPILALRAPISWTTNNEKPLVRSMDAPAELKS